jgi:hypothetical protein
MTEDYSYVYDLNGDGLLDDLKKDWRLMVDEIFSLIYEGGGI